MGERFVTDEVIYKGRVAEVHKIGLRTGDGRVVTRDLVRFGGAVVVVPVLADGSIVMIRNYRFAVDEALCELPAGMLEPGEDPQHCAVRELTEETGYVPGRIEKLGEFFTAPGATDENMHAFFATDLADGSQNLEGDEEISVHVLPEAQVRGMIRRGDIHDGKTIAALHLYWLRKDE
jgi:ADP-ribose pyrophosphatase